MFTKMEIMKFMNIQELDILKYLYIESYVNQRWIAEETGHSIGIVNKSIKSLVSQGLLSDMHELTVKGRKFIEGCKPDSAVILAAGAGMRMVPLTYQCSKALLKVKGEVLIERIIKQLRVAGVNKIYVVAGFMKEQLEYLIDEYDVELIINPEYAAKNNLHSLSLVADKLNNTFIIPCAKVNIKM